MADSIANGEFPSGEVLRGSIPFEGTFRSGCASREIGGVLQWKTRPSAASEDGMMDVRTFMFMDEETSMDEGVTGYPTGACTSLGSGFVSRLAASDAGAGSELLDMHMKSAGAAGGFDLRHAH